MKRVQIAVVMMLMVALAGCSITSNLSIRLAYSRLDNSIADKFLDYAEFDSTQEQWIRQSAREFQLWHRESELPAYAELLAQTADAIESGNKVSTASVMDLFEKLETFSDRSYAKMPFANSIALLSGLTDAQVDQIAATFEERNRKQLERIREQEAKPDNEDRIDRFETSLGRIGIDLTAVQRDIIDRGLDQYVGSRADRINVWENWQGGFLEIMDKRDQDLFADAMAMQINSYRGQMETAYPERSAANTRVAAETIANLVNSMNNEQRNELISRMRQTGIILLAMAESRQTRII